MNDTEQILHNQAIIMMALQDIITQVMPIGDWRNKTLSRLSTAILNSEQENGYER